MTVGEKIKSLRKERGITQKKLGVLCSMSEAMIRQYELGLRTPKIKTVEKIASALGVTAYQLMGNDYFDKKYPDIAKKAKEYEGFIDYLHSLGYIVNQISEASKIPIEDIPDSFKDDVVDMVDAEGFVEGETCSLELIKDGVTIILAEGEFQELQGETKDSIAFKLWQKQNKKPPE